MIELSCSCGARYGVPFLYCPRCGGQLLTVRRSDVAGVLEFYAITGQFSRKVVVMHQSVPVDSIASEPEMTKGVLNLRTDPNARNSTLHAERVYRCLQAGDQALSV